LKKLLSILFLFCCIKVFGQSETNNPITYDTTFNSSFGSIKFLIRITRQQNDTTSRPAIITGPGQGEMNHGISDTTQLSIWGPHYYIKQGWDGGITLGNGKHYPMIITIVPYNTQFPSRESYYDCLNMLLNRYHIKRNAVHIAGLSQSAFCWTDMISYEATPGDHIGMKNVTSLTALSGFALTNAADSTKYKTWSSVYDGRYFGTEGNQDVTRNTWKGAQYINSVKPNTAYFSYNNIGGGIHCCWNVEYDPNFFDWRTDPSTTKGPYYSPSQPPPFGAGGVDNQGNYKYPSSILQWMLRQGDTTLIVPNSVPDISNILTAEYRTAFLTKDSLLKSQVNASSNLTTFTLPSGRKIVAVAGGFNSYRVIAVDGTVWTNYNDNTTNWVQASTDTLGNTVNNAWYMDARADTYIILRSDSSAWLGGDDTLHIFHSTGGVQMKPTRLSPVGMKIKKILLGGNRIVALTTTGDVYEWVRNSLSTTPVQKTIPRQAIDIFNNQNDYSGCIIPDLGADQGSGYPFVWGQSFGVWGGSVGFTQPTSVKALWGLNTPIKAISCNWNTTHVIDINNDMWANGFNTNGEVGNGTENANQYTYPTPYSWSFNNENFVGPIMVQIGAGIQWKKFSPSNTFFVFFKFAQDINGNWYFWGRDKALASSRGYLNLQEQFYPNALDITKPTLVVPLNFIRKTYNFQLPTIGAGNNQNLTTSTGTLSMTGHPALLINSTNTTDTLFYTVQSVLWTKVSGPAATITSPTNKTTTVTGLTNGTYVFQVLMTDNNGGTDTGRVQLNVALNTIPPTVGAGNDTSVVGSSITITGTANGNNGATITSTNWSQISGPNTSTIVSPASLTTNITGLIVGTYIFQLSATDSNNQTSFDQVQVVVSSLTPVINGIITNKGHIKRFIRF